MAELVGVPLNSGNIKRVETNAIRTRMEFDVEKLEAELRARLIDKGHSYTEWLDLSEAKSLYSSRRTILAHYLLRDDLSNPITAEVLVETVGEIENDVRAELKRQKLLGLVNGKNDQ